MNCISWTVGHLAWHEQRTFLQRPQNIILFPHLNEVFAVGAAMSTPSFKEMLDIWHSITKAADPYLDSLTTEILMTDLLLDGKPVGQTRGDAVIGKKKFRLWKITFRDGKQLGIVDRIVKSDEEHLSGRRHAPACGADHE